MANADYCTDGKLGVDVLGNKTPSSTQEFRLGTTARCADNQVVIYVYANESLVATSGVELGASFTASATAGGELTALYAMAAGQYGWVIRGDLTVQS